MMIRNFLSGMSVNIQIGLITLALVLGFAGGWMGAKTLYEGRLYKERADIATEREKASEAARVQEANWQRATDEAVAAAERKTRANAASAARNRVLVDGLRGEIQRVTLLAEDSESAARHYSRTLGKLFGECSDHYREMAERADGHALDAGRLRAAWPKNK